jgi:hypothetical protein
MASVLLLLSRTLFRRLTKGMRMLPSRCRLFAVAILLAWVMPARAATYSAASCTSADVQSAINAARSGDTVAVPAGICTWTGTVEPIYVAPGKDITLKGAGSDSTRIMLTTYGTAINLNQTASRVTGFGFTIPQGSGADSMVLVRGQNWRVDHNTFINSDSTSKVAVFAASIEELGIRPPSGVVDHNTFTGPLRVLAFDQTDLCHANWAQPLGLGTANAVFVEDNSFIRDSVSANVMDSNTCGRYVFRFNSVTQSNLEVHSIQGLHRGPRMWEVYGNSFDARDPWFTAMHIRGGTGVSFQNHVTGSYSDSMVFDNVRSFRSPSLPPGQCDGTSPWDGNEGTGIEAGWPCRDQIGRSTDQSLWTLTSPYPRQASEPAYIWDNTLNGGVSLPSVASNSQIHIKGNRDYYAAAGAFDGTAGVGSGTLANRPITCSTGVGYWVMDRGNWNAKLPANTSGELHKCTSTNTWTLYYTPYTYPHPLVNNIPMAPTNLRIAGF